jgi:quercetin dioxygenase-like cupin family protein
MIIRRHFITSAGAFIAAPSLTDIAFAQAAGPKLTQVLRKDMEGQGAVQETVVSIVEFGPGVGAPWHMHPAAQETFYALDGNLTIEVEGRGLSGVKLGEAAIIPADLPHLARNDSTQAAARALVVHSRSAKDKPLTVAVTRS